MVELLEKSMLAPCGLAFRAQVVDHGKERETDYLHPTLVPVHGMATSSVLFHLQILKVQRGAHG